MRKGKAADVRGAAGFVAEAVATAKEAGATAAIIVRADSKFYTADVVAAARRAGAHVSLTTGSNPSVNAAIAAFTGEWTPIHYPNAFVDEETGELVSDAEVAEIALRCVLLAAPAMQVPGRLIVRRVKRLSTTHRSRDELFDVWRHHAVFTTSPSPDAAGREPAPRPRRRSSRSSPTPRHPLWRTCRPASFQANAAWADPVGDRAQPDPRRRCPRLTVPRPSYHRDDSRAPDQRPRPAGPHRTPPETPPTPALALARRPRQPPRSRPSPTATTSLTPTHPPRAGPNQTTTVEKPSRSADPPHPRTTELTTRPRNHEKRPPQTRPVDPGSVMVSRTSPHWTGAREAVTLSDDAAKKAAGGGACVRDQTMARAPRDIGTFATVAASIAAVGGLGLGGVATFQTDNEVGTAAAFAVGLFFAIVALIGRVPKVKVGDNEIDPATAYREGARDGANATAAAVDVALDKGAAPEEVATATAAAREAVEQLTMPSDLGLRLRVLGRQLSEASPEERARLIDLYLKAAITTVV